MEVLRYKDTVLRDMDLDLLRDGCFLNDQIIAFYFSYLSSEMFPSGDDEVLLLPPSVSFLIANVSSDDDQKLIGECLEPLKLSTKKLVLFTVNNNTDFGGGEDGTHWSLLVYDRAKNCFTHLDSMQGVNNFYAIKIFDALKESMGTPPASSSTNKKTKKKKSLASTAAAPPPPPTFVEPPTPQQTNGYDCGIYVLAIAKAICLWFSSPRSRNLKDNDWLSAVDRHVNSSLEFTMRHNILRLIKDLQDSHVPS